MSSIPCLVNSSLKFDIKKKVDSFFLDGGEWLTLPFQTSLHGTRMTTSVLMILWFLQLSERMMPILYLCVEYSEERRKDVI